MAFNQPREERVWDPHQSLSGGAEPKDTIQDDADTVIYSICKMRWVIFVFTHEMLFGEYVDRDVTYVINSHTINNNYIAVISYWRWNVTIVRVSEGQLQRESGRDN